MVPSWIGIASIKWLGDIQVAGGPLASPWNTRFYRFFGEGFPPEGSPPLTRQVVKSAFELPFDGGATWRPAAPTGPALGRAWPPWEFRWRPARTGSHTLLARAADETGATQPDQVPHNTLGYLFGAVVRHPVTVV